MTRCNYCTTNYPSHEILDGRCPICRDTEGMLPNSIQRVWEDAIQKYQAQERIDKETISLWS